MAGSPFYGVLDALRPPYLTAGVRQQYERAPNSLRFVPVDIRLGMCIFSQKTTHDKSCVLLRDSRPRHG
jgi:hypothetical protein